MDRAVIVVDLGFGDAGKGLVTDYLVRTLGARLVVRFHGGAQAGHNVVTPDGRHHTFAQLGAGTFVPGVMSYLGSAVVVHPTALWTEAKQLALAGVTGALERLAVSEQALITTPFHQAAGRLRELARGATRHGSCGAGVGETVGDALNDRDAALRMGQLRHPSDLRPALVRVQARKRQELTDELSALAGCELAGAERRILEDPAVIDRWLEAVAPVASRIAIVDDSWIRAALRGPGRVVLEGAQGVLLDEWAGFHPHTTWSTCTFERALDLLREHGFRGELTRMGVLRCYTVRHGAGPLPTEDRVLDTLPERHNASGPWQGPVRRAWPDLMLLRYALEVCCGADALAITHLDALGQLPAWHLCSAYALPQLDPALFDAAQVDPRRAVRIRPPVARDLARQAALGAALVAATPIYETFGVAGGERDDIPGKGEHAAAEDGTIRADHVLELFEERLNVPVRLASSGPCSVDVRAQGELFRGE